MSKHPVMTITMITIKIKFESNRYSATPWDNNVNENIPEWPPSIYRLYRAMIDSWYRRTDYTEEQVIKVFSVLTATMPCYKIPEYTSSYTVSFMNIKTGTNIALSESSLIYNPFININEPLYIVYNMDIDEESRAILNKILNGINFLGRSESWVSMSLTDEEIKCNFMPSENGSFYVPVATKVDTNWLKDMEQLTSNTVKSNLPRTMKIIRYDFTGPLDTGKQKIIHKESHLKSVIYELSSVYLPSIYDTLIISDKIHKLLISKGIKLYVHNFEKFSGRKDDGTLLKGHRHLYILPLDIDKDGKIDHILLKGKENLNADEISVIENIHALYMEKRKIQLTPVGYYSNNNYLKNFPSSRNWISATPVIFSRHYKKNKGTFYQWMYNELVTELKFHSVISDDKELEKVELLEYIKRNSRKYYWLNYRRSRKDEPENGAYGFKLIFKNEISGPFAIGTNAHYGLGLFMPTGDDIE